jgi:hypothetical protein
MLRAQDPSDIYGLHEKKKDLLMHNLQKNPTYYILDLASANLSNHI